MESTRRLPFKAKRELSITELPVAQQTTSSTRKPPKKRKLSHARSLEQNEEIPMVSDNSSLRIMIQQNSDSGKTASFHGHDLPTKNEPPSVKECRICFSASTSPTAGSQGPMRMLTNPCNCKGSMSYVHESCLIQWLLARNIRKCELCHSEFNVREQYGSLWEIARSSAQYLFANYKRTFKFAIYSVYMFLFFKRFVYVLRYFGELGAACLKGYFAFIKRVLKFILMAPKTGLQSLIQLDFSSLTASLTYLSSIFRRQAR